MPYRGVQWLEPTFEYNQLRCPERLRKTTKTSVMKIDVPGEFGNPIALEDKSAALLT